ncbi:GCN5-related N-acetyltransferase [Methanosarcina sp. Kolksee]|nr:GCN5-related N-acetyltransferase [Methanosarcina sp. Kolksee]
MEGLAPEDFVLAEIDGKITGCAALIKSEFHGKNFLEIHSIAVHPNFRGKGVGTRLVKHLLTTTGDSCCDLYVRTTAPIFFEKLDFKKVENSEKLSLWKDCENCEHFEKCTQHAMKYSYK